MTDKPTRFRKKPVVIEAMQFKPMQLGETIRDFERQAVHIAKWCGGRFNAEAKASDRTDAAYWITIPTLEGNMHAAPGDWIIRGVKGEFYPCKPDIFAATYEPAEPSSTVRHRDAITGQYVDADEAAARPDTTVRETRKP